MPGAWPWEVEGGAPSHPPSVLTLLIGLVLNEVSALRFEIWFQQVPGSGIGCDSRRGWATWMLGPPPTAPGSTRMCQRPGGDPPGLLPPFLHMYNLHWPSPPGHCSGGGGVGGWRQGTAVQNPSLTRGHRRVREHGQCMWLGSATKGLVRLVRDLSFH